MSIADRLYSVKSSLPAQTRLVAVSKYHPAEQLKVAYDAGQRIFGESHVQEVAQKAAVLPQDIEWHFIGHLQTNKVKQLVPFVSMIHSIDSIHLLEEVNKQALKIGRTVDCLLEVHVAQEDSKYGFSAADVLKLVADGTLNSFSNVRVRGLMAMATNTDDQNEIRREFRSVRDLLTEAKAAGASLFNELSMGMSGDYQIAVEEGSTLVRVGTTIFGPRDYSK